MPPPHPLVLLGFGLAAVVGVVAAMGVAFARAHQSQHQYHHDREPDLPPPDRMHLGPCGMCDGDVSAVGGFRAPCGHFVHYTCNAEATRELRGVKVTKNIWCQICRACLKDRISRRPSQPHNEGLRRRNDARQCPCCLLGLADGKPKKKLPCDHQVHRACWERMESSGLTTCPRCAEDV